MSGRPPDPERIAWLKGDTTKIRHKYVEPIAPLGCPECPTHFDDVAKAEWLRITTALDSMALLSKADATTLEIYCQAYARYRKAEERLKTEGEIIVCSSGYQTISPQLTIINRCVEQMHKLLVEFGMTPAARSRMRLKKQDKPKGKWDGLLDTKKTA